MKTLIEVPSLREQLPKTNKKGMDFNEFTKELGTIYKNTVSTLFNKTGVPEDILGEVQSEFLARKEKEKEAKLRKAGKSVSPSKKEGSEVNIASSQMIGQSKDVR